MCVISRRFALEIGSYCALASSSRRDGRSGRAKALAEKAPYPQRAPGTAALPIEVDISQFEAFGPTLRTGGRIRAERIAGVCRHYRLPLAKRLATVVRPLD